MKGSIEKTLKRFLKGKINIKESLVVAFLIIGNLSAAITYDEAIINGSNPTGSNLGNGVNFSEGNSDDIIIEGGIYGKIYGEDSSTGTATRYNMGNGIGINLTKEQVSIGSISNYGIVSGKTEEIKFTNLGNYTIQSSANGVGINAYTANISTQLIEMKEIANKGIISGNFSFRDDRDVVKQMRGNGNGVSLFSTVSSSTAPQGAIFSIGEIRNDGLIEGNANLDIYNYTQLRGLGNGFLVLSSQAKTDIVPPSFEMIENTGILTGKAELSISKPTGSAGAFAFGNGLSFYRATSTGTPALSVSQIENKGIIAGNATITSAESLTGSTVTSAGNGISVYGNTGDNIGEISNNGVIRGKFVKTNINTTGTASYSYGNGIHTTGTLSNLENTGLIAGSNHAVYANNIVDGKNYGVLVGKTISNKTIENNGVQIKLDDEGNVVSIENGLGGIAVDGKNIINGNIVGNDSSLIAEANYENTIINGAGVDKGVLDIVSGITSLQGSIINAYKTAISIGTGAKLQAKDTIFNGGGLDGETPVIKGDSGENTVEITGTSVINGNIDLGAGNDELALSDASAFNGTIIDGGEGSDTLNITGTTQKTTDNMLKVYGTIKNFKDVNVLGNFTLFETAKIEGVENIALGNGGNLYLRIDMSQDTGNVSSKTSYDTSGKLINHALYDTGAKLTSDGGKITIVAAGISTDSIIGMGSTDISSLTNEDLMTNSIAHQVIVNGDGDLKVEISEKLPGEVSGANYKNLQNIWAAIDGSQQVGLLAPTIEYGGEGKTKKEAEEALYDILEDILIGNPAGVSAKGINISMLKFNDIVQNDKFMPNYKKWALYGGVTHSDSEADKLHEATSYYNGKISTDYSSYSGYGRAEYGYAEKTALGLLLGGENSRLKNTTGSKLDGNSGYIGAYIKNDVYNMEGVRIYAGIGYQYTDFSGERIIGNEYQTISNDQKFSANAFNGYAGLKYEYNLGKNFKLEPRFKFSLTEVNQDSINEGNGALAMNIESKTFTYMDTELGLSLMKELNFKKGTGRLKVGAAWLRALQGTDADTMSARFSNGGDSFDILIAQGERDSIKYNLSYEFEKLSGWSYYVGADYITATDMNDLSINLSAGYKF